MPNIHLSHLPSTQEGAKLYMSKEQEEKCKLVYKKATDGKGATFAGLWCDEADYSDDYVIVPLRSTYGGLTRNEYPIGTKFANVEGSSDDGKYRPSYDQSTSWVSLLRNAYAGSGYSSASCCAELNKIYEGGSNDDRSSPKAQQFLCSRAGSMAGGHVLLHADNSSAMNPGDTVYLLPICTAHNIYNYTGNQGEAGKGFYMKLARPMKAVILTGYLQPPN